MDLGGIQRRRDYETQPKQLKTQLSNYLQFISTAARLFQIEKFLIQIENSLTQREDCLEQTENCLFKQRIVQHYLSNRLFAYWKPVQHRAGKPLYIHIIRLG